MYVLCHIVITICTKYFWNIWNLQDITHQLQHVCTNFISICLWFSFVAPPHVYAFLHVVSVIDKLAWWMPKLESALSLEMTLSLILKATVMNKLVQSSNALISFTALTLNSPATYSNLNRYPFMYSWGMIQGFIYLIVQLWISFSLLANGLGLRPYTTSRKCEFMQTLC